MKISSILLIGVILIIIIVAVIASIPTTEVSEPTPVVLVVPAAPAPVISAPIAPIIATIPENQFITLPPFVYGEVAGIGKTWHIADPHFDFDDQLIDQTTLFHVSGVGYIAELDVNIDNLESISFPDLQVVGDFEFDDMTNLTLFNFPKLKSVFGNLDIYNTSGPLTTLSFPKLVHGVFTEIYENNDFTNIDLPLLSYNADDLEIYENTNLSVLNLDSLHTCEGRLEIYDNPNLTSFSLPSLKVYGDSDVNFSDNGFDEATVDGLLATFASLDGTDGTLLWENRDFDISGGTNAAPSAAGMASIVIIEARGNSVDYN
jgi:hypothetical protein